MSKRAMIVDDEENIRQMTRLRAIPRVHPSGRGSVCAKQYPTVKTFYSQGVNTPQLCCANDFFLGRVRGLMFNHSYFGKPEHESKAGVKPAKAFLKSCKFYRW